MRVLRWAVFALTLLVIAPASSYAQATLSGTVKDTSGAVLPGVTVEASSPVLIEKIRTAVTDSSGQYRIIDLPPGPYTLNFTLTGFSVSSARESSLPASRSRRSMLNCASVPFRKPSQSPAKRRSSTCRARAAARC